MFRQFSFLTGEDLNSLYVLIFCSWFILSDQKSWKDRCNFFDINFAGVRRGLLLCAVICNSGPKFAVIGEPRFGIIIIVGCLTGQSEGFLHYRMITFLFLGIHDMQRCVIQYLSQEGICLVPPCPRLFGSSCGHPEHNQLFADGTGQAFQQAIHLLSYSLLYKLCLQSSTALMSTCCADPFGKLTDWEQFLRIVKSIVLLEYIFLDKLVIWEGLFIVIGRCMSFYGFRTYVNCLQIHFCVNLAAFSVLCQ